VGSNTAGQAPYRARGNPRWSGRDRTLKAGRAPTKGEDVYVITGDSGMGLTHGTLGARLVTDLMLGRENAWAELYDPNRKPLHSLGTYAQENLNTAVQFAQAVTPGATRRPPSTAAASRRSGRRALVQEPMKTQSTLVPAMGRPASSPM